MANTWERLANLRGPQGLGFSDLAEVDERIKEVIAGRGIGVTNDDIAATCEIESLGIPLLASDAGASVASTAAQTTLFAGTRPDVVDPQIGDGFRIEAWGLITNNTGSNRTLTLRVALDTTTIVQLVSGNIGTDALPRAWFLEALLRVTDNDATGGVTSRAELHGTGAFATTPDTAFDRYQAPVASGTIDFTQAQTVNVTAQLSASSSDLTCDCDGILVMPFVA